MGGYHYVLTLERWCHGTTPGSHIGPAGPPGCAQTSPAEGAVAGAASRLLPWHPGKGITCGEEERGVSLGSNIPHRGASFPGSLPGGQSKGSPVNTQLLAGDYCVTGCCVPCE